MFEFHADKNKYFDMQVQNTRNHVLPFIEKFMTIESGTRVLEIGCGEAGVLKAFIDRGCIGVGVELEEGRLVYARQFMQAELASNKVSFISEDIYKVNAEQAFQGNFDIIILKDVIEHIHDQPKLIAWMKSFLNKNGVVFFGFPPWQMPFGGHQQILGNRFLSKLPYFHLLPMALYKMILKIAKEDVASLAEIKDTQISIEQFERIAAQTGYKVVNQTHYLVNPIYEYKFGWKPKVQRPWISRLKYIRNYFTTCVYYLITPQ